MMDQELYEALNQLLTAKEVRSGATGFADSYYKLGRLLKLLLRERTSTSQARYSGDLARLYALCKLHKHPHQRLCTLWQHLQQVSQNEWQPEHDDFLYDAKALAEGIRAFYQSPIPESLEVCLPSSWRPLKETPRNAEFAKRIRMVVTAWTDNSITGYDVSQPASQAITAQIPEQHLRDWHLSKMLYENVQVNLLSVTLASDGTLVPEIIVLEPDYIIDITTICRCIKGLRTSPIHHLMGKFMPSISTTPILLGNAANQFLDDCIHHADDENLGGLYMRSLQKNLHDYALAYCTDEGVTKAFFKSCEEQFKNLNIVVTDLFPANGISADNDNVQLEASFLCEALGIQGRVDLITSDLTRIVELKSGKEQEWPSPTYKDEHALQMALYKEMLYYNLGLPKSQVSTLLLYSRYPKLYDIRLGMTDIQRAIQIRNGIVYMERLMSTQRSTDVLDHIRESHFLVDAKPDDFYTTYIQPEILSFLSTLQGKDELTHAYFHAMLQFMQREQFLAKMGDGRLDSDHGFAQIWQAEERDKMAQGDILPHLTLEPRIEEDGIVSTIDITIPTYSDDFQPNFRQGDSVMIYRKTESRGNGPVGETFRATIEQLTATRITLQLNYPQRENAFGGKLDEYVIEPSHMDGSYTTGYRGLYKLLSIPKERRDLILAKRKPERIEGTTLSTKIEDTELQGIITDAMSAKDYYLLVGPPGTGKTSVALATMVNELLTSHPEEDILLAAYTNRAVDEICQMLEQLPDSPDYIRIGKELACAPEYRPHLLSTEIKPLKNRPQIIQKVKDIRIICGTVSALSGTQELFFLKQFGTLIVDEASQVLEPQMLPLLCATDKYGQIAIKRFIMIGDHKQLPAVVAQHAELSDTSGNKLLSEIGLRNCRDSLFERLHRMALKNGCQHAVGLLHRQGRMHPALSAFVSKAFYGGKLGIVPLPHQQGNLEWKEYDHADKWQTYVATNRLGFLDCIPKQRQENNKVNQPEAYQAALLVRALCDLCIANGKDFDPQHQLGIIVPFRSQIAMIRKELAKQDIPNIESISIDTVERYQGSQRDVIIFTTVVSQRYQLDILSAPVEAEGQMVDRKLNVAITRARKQFFLVGNLSLLRQCKAYADFLEQ